ELHKTILQVPLSWLPANLRPDGEIPVFFTQDVPGADDTMTVWGNSCAAVEMNGLLGLLDYDWSTYAALIETSAQNLFRRIGQWGLMPLGHYGLAYGLWGTFKLMHQLSTKTPSAELQTLIDQAIPVLRQQLKQAAQQAPLTPQNAAFFTLACCDYPPNRFLLEEGWITQLIKRQHYDGSWDNEPLFATCQQGGQSTWYTSRSVTTAFCYHALRSYHGGPQ
ncbi:MAG: hypothetical protein WCD18_28025, partial [Thermosynechococcaceae cyanobacterium]